MPKKPHIAAVVQARMKSTRLPGKVMSPIVGEPLIWHILHRLKKSELIETLCVATTRDPADDELAAYAAAQGAKVVRGPEDDVLGRLALASYTIDPDVIVRVNADAPLVDAGYVDYLIRELMRHQADYVTLKPGLSAIHDGAEVMSRWALDKLVVKAHQDPVAREYVTAYFKLHPDFINVAAIDLPEKWRFDGARLSIDTPADVTFIEAVYARLHAQAGEATLTDLVALLHREPSLLDLNAPPQLRAQTGGTVILHCDGSRASLGRVRRCLSVARALRDREGLAVRFAVRGDAFARGAVEEAGFAAELMPSDTSEIDWLLALAETHKPCAMMLDVASDLSATSVMRLRGADLMVGVIDDLTPRRLAADASFYAPVPQVFSLNWEGAEAEPHVGWEWVALAQDALPPLPHRETRPQVMVSLADPELTVTAMRALGGLERVCDVTVVLGLGAPRDLEARVMRFAPSAAILHSANDLPKLMGEVDLALVCAGLAACEVAALGVPAIYLCGGNDEDVRASAFERAGMGYALHVHVPDEAKIAAAVNDLLADAPQRRAMSVAGRMNIDGRGAMRIAHRLKQLVEERAEALAVRDRAVERRALAVC